MQCQRRTLIFGAAGGVAVDPVEPDAVGLRAIGLGVGQRTGHTAGIPALAGHGAGMTAHAQVQIDDQAELALGGSGQGGQVGRPFSMSVGSRR